MKGSENMRTMTGMKLLDMYLKNAIIESKSSGLSPQEIFDNYNIQDIDPNKIYKVNIYYSDASDDPDEIIEYTEVE